MRKLRATVARERSGVSQFHGEYTAHSDASALLSGVTGIPGVTIPVHPRKGRNTNANRKNGGGGMYFKPRTSAGYGDAPTTIPKRTLVQIVPGCSHDRAMYLVISGFTGIQAEKDIT